MDNDIIELLSHVDPARLDYAEWLSVGMALKNEEIGRAHV